MKKSWVFSMLIVILYLPVLSQASSTEGSLGLVEPSIGISKSRGVILQVNNYSKAKEFCINSTENHATCKWLQTPKDQESFHVKEKLVGKDGNKTFFGFLKRKRGYIAKLNSVCVILDTRSPTVSFTGVKRLADGKVQLNWSGDDHEGKISYYRLTGNNKTQFFDFTTSTIVDGLVPGQVYTFQLKSWDWAGNCSKTVHTKVKAIAEVDPPGGSVSINGGAEYTLSHKVVLYLSASDASLKDLKMCISNNTSCKSWKTFTSPVNWSLTSGEGPKTVNVWFKDRWGNIGGPFASNITVGTPPPSPPSTPTGLNATSEVGGVSLTWNSVSDATSYDMYWSTDKDFAKATGTKISGLSNPYYDFTATPGTYYFVVTAQNHAGEESEVSEKVEGRVLTPPMQVKGDVIKIVKRGDRKCIISENTYHLFVATFDKNNSLIREEELLPHSDSNFNYFRVGSTAIIDNNLYIPIVDMDAACVQKGYVSLVNMLTGETSSTATSLLPIGAASDEVEKILYLVKNDKDSGVNSIDAIDITTQQVIATRRDDFANPSYGAFYDGTHSSTIFSQKTGTLLILGMIYEGGGYGYERAKVFRFTDTLATESGSFAYNMGNENDSRDNPLNIAASADDSEIVISAELNSIDWLQNALLKINVATGTIAQFNIPATAIDLAFDNDNNLYVIVGTDLVKFTPDFTSQKVLRSNVSHMTLDREAGTLYIASNDSSVRELDLDGKEK